MFATHYWERLESLMPHVDDGLIDLEAADVLAKAWVLSIGRGSDG